MSTTALEPTLDPTASGDPAPRTAATGLLGRMGAETFGTFVLVLLGGGAAVYSSIGALGTGVLGVGLAVALAVGAAGSAVAHVSGAHLNPAITLGTAIAGRLSWRDVLPYWLAQLVGGTLAGLALFLGTPQTFATALQLESQRDAVALAANGFAEHAPLAAASGGAIDVTLQNALIIEAIAAAVLVGVFLGVTSRTSRVANPLLLVGLAMGGLMIITVPLTNGGLNPARSFGIAVFSTSWALSQLWLFALAPLLGAAVAGAVYRLLVTDVPAAVTDPDFLPDEPADQHVATHRDAEVETVETVGTVDPARADTEVEAEVDDDGNEVSRA